MTNKLTMDQLGDLPIAQSLDKPLDHLHGLQEEISAAEAKLKSAKAWLSAALDLRFKTDAAKLRKDAGKDFGTVRLEKAEADERFLIECDLEKKAEWDQAKIGSAVLELQKLGEKPREYVETTYKVSETKFKAWPERIRKLFEPARTVKPGAAKYRITKKEPE
ncbi:hypothetical protein [Azospirillum sp. TSO5]|uniref:hypothetical protein n=1 Tax=Azospirillum sp. TSO5 TaxID=716760 RepID=UPI000D6545A8|nr:hypothetical protein [Azospirillum sp. TSO5]